MIIKSNDWKNKEYAVLECWYSDESLESWLPSAKWKALQWAPKDAKSFSAQLSLLQSDNRKYPLTSAFIRYYTSATEGDYLLSDVDPEMPLSRKT